MSDCNWHTEALLRGAKTVPEWWTKVGRDNVYALKWTTGAVDWYQSEMTPAPIRLSPDGGFTFWFKITQALVPADGDVGLFGYIQAGSRDLIAVHIHHVAGRGNVLTATVKVNTGAYQFTDSQTNFGSAGLGETWHNFTYEIVGGAGQAYIDGTALTTSPALILHSDVFNGDRVYLGAASLTAGLHLSAKYVILDEWAFAEGNKMSPTLAYNSGVPKVWNTTANPEIVGWYPLDKNVGAITNRGLYNYITGVTAYPNFLWSVTGTTGRPSIVTDALRKTDTNAYFQLATNYAYWVKGAAVDSRYAIGSGQEVRTVTPALMSPPAGGGFSTMGYTGAFIGNHEEPFATPIFSAATTVLSSMDSTAYVATGGTGSLTAITNNKTSRKLFPSFVRKV